MNRTLYWCGLVALALAGNARAAAFEKVDPRSPTVINSSVVSLPTVNLGTVPAAIYGTGVAPESRSMFGTRLVETKVKQTRTVETSTVGQKVLPPVTRETKRTDVSDQLRPAATVESKAASIPDRLIRPYTREGAEELKNQLRQTP